MSLSLPLRSRSRARQFTRLAPKLVPPLLSHPEVKRWIRPTFYLIFIKIASRFLPVKRSSGTSLAWPSLRKNLRRCRVHALWGAIPSPSRLKEKTYRYIQSGSDQLRRHHGDAVAQKRVKRYLASVQLRNPSGDYIRRSSHQGAIAS